jgi:hypothetical protein
MQMVNRTERMKLKKKILEACGDNNDVMGNASVPSTMSVDVVEVDADDDRVIELDADGGDGNNDGKQDVTTDKLSAGHIGSASKCTKEFHTKNPCGLTSMVLTDENIKNFFEPKYQQPRSRTQRLLAPRSSS